MKNLLDAVFDNVHMAHSTRDDLYYIADRLSFVGMKDVADALSRIAQEVERSALDIREAFSDEQASQLSHNEKMVDGLMELAIRSVPTKP